MTGIKEPQRPKEPRPPTSGRAVARAKQTGEWRLQDAKARFSELVRRVRGEAQEHVAVHGRDDVVVIAAEECRRLKRERTGEALIEAIQASPYRDIEIEPRRKVMPARDARL